MDARLSAQAVSRYSCNDCGKVVRKAHRKAYWKKWDWGKAIEFGMQYAGLSYSGEFDFVETSYVFPTTHMVAPKEDAVTCDQCHRENGRLAGIEGIYMPSTNNTPIIDKLGWAIALLALIGVLIHGAIRYFMHKRGN